MKNIYIVGVAILLTGCGDAIQSPVVGMLGSERAQGQAVARWDGTGTFFVATPRGLECNGTYDALDTNPTIRATATCNNGRTGTCIITRNIARMTGSAICSDNRGTFGRFVFGDISFTETFNEGGVQTF
jgi:hypothetical protein